MNSEALFIYIETYLFYSKQLIIKVNKEKDYEKRRNKKIKKNSKSQNESIEQKNIKVYLNLTVYRIMYI